MQLNVKERFMVMQLLPREADITTIKLVMEAKLKLGLTEAELLLFEVKQIPTPQGEMTAWDDKKEDLYYAEKGMPNFDIGQILLKHIQDELKKLNESKKLTESHISLYTKVVEGGLLVIK
jgi:hypothetical protein